MANANYQNDYGGAEEMEAKLKETTWWPLFALLGILGALLFWEALNPLPLIPAQVVSFAALGLLFGGVTLWLMVVVKE